MSDMHKLMYGDLDNYMVSKLPKNKKAWMIALKDIAIEQKIPIMDEVSMEYVRQLIRIIRPKRILEIGTGIGYSALMMHDAFPYCDILSIEKDHERYKESINHIESQNKQDRIHVVHGDALDVLKQMPTGDTFDLILIDASKGQYQKFFELAEPLISPGGTIISDNVLFRGYVVDGQSYPAKFKTLVKNLKSFNDWLAEHANFTTSFLPIGDGLAVSIHLDARI